jgi:hypothetical protein
MIDSPQKAALMAGAIRVGPAGDRVELAGGDIRESKGGYEIVYHFPGRETKWLMCAYGKGGEIQRFERMSERATECKLQVRESKRDVSAKMTCK